VDIVIEAGTVLQFTLSYAHSTDADQLTSLVNSFVVRFNWRGSELARTSLEGATHMRETIRVVRTRVRYICHRVRAETARLLGLFCQDLTLSVILDRRLHRKP
jgi:hypothetical protein